MECCGHAHGCVAPSGSVRILVDPEPNASARARPATFRACRENLALPALPPSSSQDHIHIGAGRANFGRIGNDRINELYAQASAELDEQRKIELANEADQEIWAVGHSLLLYQRPNIIATRSNVANFGAKGFAEVKYRQIGFTN